jgi:O-methyltransferase domain
VPIIAARRLPSQHVFGQYLAALRAADARLRTCRSATGPAATLLLMQGVLSDHPRPDALNKILDIQMLVITENGRQRTRGEFAELLEQAGLRLIGVRPELPSA